MAAVIKIAKQGKNVSSTDPRDFSLNLSYYLFKILTEVIMQSVSSGASVDVNAFGWLLLYEKDPTSGKWKIPEYEYVKDFDDSDGWTYNNSHGSAADITYFLTVDDFES